MFNITDIIGPCIDKYSTRRFDARFACFRDGCGGSGRGGVVGIRILPDDESQVLTEPRGMSSGSTPLLV